MLCEVLAAFPTASYILFVIGSTVNVSPPFAVPDRDITSVYVFPLADMLEGVELLKDS